MSEPSLKIKIPAKATGEISTKSISAPRKAAKRRITSDDEREDVPSPRSKHHAKPPFKKKRLSPKPGSDCSSLLSPHQTTKPAQTQTASGPLATSTKTFGKKRTRIVSDEEDGDFIPEPEEKPTLASRAKLKDGKGKAKAGDHTKAAAKNESKSTLPPTPGPTGTKRPRQEEDAEVDVTSVPPATTPATAVLDEPPPKKKLPPIKKKKKTDSTATSTAASPAPVSTAAPKSVTSSLKPLPPSQMGLPKKPQAPVQATTMNASGSGDFDLRDSNTWRSLIGKGPTNSGPRIGIEKRVSTEERRKQLDKMRDDARIAREQQARETFDLQAQSRKIAAFEKKLQYEHRVKINGPHNLGAAFLARPIPDGRPR